MKPRPISLHRMLDQRSLGYLPYGSSQIHIGSVCRQLYSELQCVRMWNPLETTDHQCHGAIFNFDFTKDGLVSAVWSNSNTRFFLLLNCCLGDRQDVCPINNLCF